MEGKNRTLLGALFLVSAVALAATFAFPLAPRFRTVKSASGDSIRYDSRATAVAPRLEATQASIEDFSASMDFRSYSTQGYNDLFATAPFNQGVRVELSGKTMGLIVAAKNANGYDPYAITTGYDPAVPHTLDVAIDRAHHVSAWFDHQQVVDIDAPDLDYAISDLTVGSGFSKDRRFNGAITRFAYSYGFYEPGSPSRVWLWIRLALFSICIAALFLLARGGPLTLSSTLPELS